MKLIWYCVLWVSHFGCASADEPNPLEKANDKLPVVNMPLGYFPPDKDSLDTPPEVESVPVATEFALEGKLEVNNPPTFRSLPLYVKIIRKINNRKVIANTHIGGKPVQVKGKTYRYRSAVKSPANPGHYTIEVYIKRDLVTTAEFDVKEKNKEKEK